MQSRPLWGLLVSIKDCIQQRGTDATYGAAAKCFKPFAEDGLQVPLLIWMVTDDWFEAAGAYQRAVRMAGNALQEQVLLLLI